MFTHLKIGRRLVLGFGLLVLLMIGAASAVGVALGSIRRSVDIIETRFDPSGSQRTQDLHEATPWSVWPWSSAPWRPWPFPWRSRPS